MKCSIDGKIDTTRPEAIGKSVQVHRGFELDSNPSFSARKQGGSAPIDGSID